MGSTFFSILFLSAMALTASPIAPRESGLFVKSIADLEKIDQSLHSTADNPIGEKFRLVVDEIQKNAPVLEEKVREYRLMQQDEVLTWIPAHTTALELANEDIEPILQMSRLASTIHIKDKIKLEAIPFGNQILWKAEAFDLKWIALAKIVNRYYSRANSLKRTLNQESFTLLTTSFSEIKFDLINKLQRTKTEIPSDDVVLKTKYNHLLESFYGFGANISFSYQNNDLTLKGVLLGDNPQNALQNYMKMRFF